MSSDGGVSRRQVEKLAALPVAERREHVSDLGELLASESPYVTQRAMDLLVETAAAYPGEVTAVIDPVAEQLGTHGVGTAAARVVAAVAAEEPAAVSERLPLLVAVLDSGGAVTAHVTDALASIGETSPDTLARRGIVETLFELLDDEDPAVRTNATGVLGDIAGTNPGAVAAGAAKLRARLDDESPAVQQHAASTLGQLASHSPAAVFEAMPELCALLESEDQGVRSAAVYTLGEATAAAEAVDESGLDALLAGLQADAAAVRQQTAFVIAEVAAADPALVAPQARRLTRSLADGDPQVRRNLLAALDRLDASVPDAVDTARADVGDAFEGLDPADAADVTPAQLRALAGDERAPDTLRRGARTALLDAGGERLDTASSGGRQCPNCGEEFGPDATFCSVCGASLE